MTVPTVRFVAVGLRLATFVHAVQPCCLLSVDETHLNAVKERIYLSIYLSIYCIYLLYLSTVSIYCIYLLYLSTLSIYLSIYHVLSIPSIPFISIYHVCPIYLIYRLLTRLSSHPIDHFIICSPISYLYYLPIYLCKYVLDGYHNIYLSAVLYFYHIYMYLSYLSYLPDLFISVLSDHILSSLLVSSDLDLILSDVVLSISLILS